MQSMARGEKRDHYPKRKMQGRCRLCQRVIQIIPVSAYIHNGLNTFEDILLRNLLRFITFNALIIVLNLILINEFDEIVF